MTNDMNDALKFVEDLMKMPPPAIQLEPEQIAALKYVDKCVIFPSLFAIKQATDCNELAIGDLLHKGLLVPVMGNWGLTEAGEREARR